MKFNCSVDIKAPLEKVIDLFDDPDNLKEWQDGFESFENLSGEPGQPGTKSRMIYNIRGKPMELIETITVRNLPHEFSGTYDHKHMSNSMKNYFEDLGDGQTRYRTEVEYTQFHSFPIKILAKLFPGMFKKQVQKWMDQFKGFVERN